tara:strand:- start:1456 stop:1827 length:372 start_codon:yes stop_codon:yes gene_type:complete
MEAKQVIPRAYKLFSDGEMEAWTETNDDNVIFTMPGDKHPFSGVCEGKQAMLELFAKIPVAWYNFNVEPVFMISEGNKVFVKCHAKADGIDTIFGHYFEINNEGKTVVFTSHDDTLSSYNAMK